MRSFSEAVADTADAQRMGAPTNGNSPAGECNMQRVLPGETNAPQPLGGPAVGAATHVQLGVQQLRAAELIANGMSLREVAERLGVHRTTVFRWRQSSPAFDREVRRQSRVASGELAGIARGLLLKASRYVDRALEGDYSRDSWVDRVMRNRRLWDLALSARENDDDAASVAEASA